MIEGYVNTGRGRRVPISPAVPGAQYRITAWALGNGSRSETPTVESVTTGEASKFCITGFCPLYTFMCMQQVLVVRYVDDRLAIHVH